MNQGGIGLCGILTVVFITLKLIGEIAWPWIWVLAPAWIPTAVVFVIFIIVAVISAIAIPSFKRLGFLLKRGKLAF